MKLKNIFMLLALAMGTCAFVACGDDEVNPSDNKPGNEQPTDSIDNGQPTDSISPAAPTAMQVLGTYTGWTHLETTYLSRNYANDTLTISLMEEEMQIGSTMLQLTFTDKTWGVATIKGAVAVPSDEGYVIAKGSGFFVTFNPRDNTTQEIPCHLEHATLSSDKTQLTAVIIAHMEEGHGNMTFTFQTGEMPTEE